MKEKELLQHILRQGRIDGWNIAHFGNSVKFIKRGGELITIPDKDATGFPDLVMVRQGELIFAELKSDTGRISDEQALWLADLRHVEKMLANRFLGPRVYLWYPKDWDDGTIKEVLR